MATGWVRAGFFYTRTRLMGQFPWPGPGPLTKRVFFPGPRPTPDGPCGPVKGLGPIHGPTQKKKKILDPNTNTNSHDWGELNPPQKKEKRKKNGDSARLATARTKWSWDLRQTGTARMKLPPSLLKSVRTTRMVSSSGFGTSICQK